VYGDRTHSFASIPPGLIGLGWIKAANDSKSYIGDPLVSFEISEEADVHVAIDSRGPVPFWVDGTWAPTGENLTVRESASTVRTFNLYRKRMESGQVSLGPWNSGNSMYVVIVK
jgi:hypothetical protein